MTKSESIVKVSRLLIVCRHAEAYKNLHGVHGGGNQDLTPLGIEQSLHLARALDRVIKARGVDVRLVHQPEGRSRATAQIVAKHCSLESEEAAELAGVNLGLLSGLSDAEVGEKYPEVAQGLAEWRSGGKRSPPRMPGSEGLDEFADRILGWLYPALMSESEIDTLVVVGTTSTANMMAHLVKNAGTLERASYDFYPLALGGLLAFGLETSEADRSSAAKVGWRATEFEIGAVLE